MTSYQNILLKKTSSIKEALTVINKGAIQIALVVDDKNKLLGTLTDGDIRRGLINDYQLTDSIEPLISKEPTVGNINDTKEKILNLAISKKLHQIPIIDNNGKLVGIEKVDNLLKPEIKKNKVVLMVGGLGTRLRPLTVNTPKPMLKVGNKPILETIILNFKKYGFINIILCVSYKSEIIKEYFKDGSVFGVNIEYVHENKRMGTAGALSLIREKLKEPFFVMNGDLLTNINFENMMEYHSSNDLIATMGVREYDFQVPYGVVNISGKDIVSIEEKPVHNFYVSGGIYILEPKVLEFIPDNIFYDMPTLFKKLIKNNFNPTYFTIREYWMDIGRIEELKKANEEYINIF